MSDSDEDFASADEGEVEKSSGAESKVKEKPTEPVVKPDESKQAHQKKGKPGKGADKKPHQPTGARPKVKEDPPKENLKQQLDRPESGKNKKGKQKGGKGKGAGQKVKEAETGDNKTSVAESKLNEGSQESKIQGASGPTETKSDSKGDSEEQKQTDSPGKQEKDTEPQETNTDNAKSDNEPIKSSSAVTPETEKSDTSIAPEERVSKGSDLDTKEEQATLLKSPSSQSITRPAPDHTDQQEEVLDKLSGAAPEKKTGWGWGWGSSLLEVASTSVSTFTKEVGEGLHTMMETVESTLNVPNPEELARDVKQEPQSGDADNATASSKEVETIPDDNGNKKSAETQSKTPEKPSQEPGTSQPSETSETTTEQTGNQSGSGDDGGWFSAWGVSNISKMVESTSKNLVSSSLDVLETLGKKTFDAINERDPGLKKTRGFLHDRGDKPNLSAVLRDAKEQEEVRAVQEKESEEARKAHFGSLFDDFQGLAYLEALEMLSNQCEKRVNSLLSALPSETITSIKPVLLLVKQNFEISEDDEEEVEEQEFNLLVTELLKQLAIGTTPDKLIKTHDNIEEHFQECCVTEDKKPDPKDIHRVAISGLAELTSKCIEQFQKAGELILVHKAELPNFVATSETLQRLTKVLSAEVNILSTKFTVELNKLESGDEIKVNHLVTNIYLEATNSSSYIQDGFQLLLPVIQQAAIEKSQEPET